MSEENVYVTFTMDCERDRRESKCGGPESWEVGERNVLAYAEILKSGGMTATFFIIPATAQKQGKMFLELEKIGFELGMHFHCQSFRDCSCPEPIGWHTYEEQLKILGEAKQDWTQGIGRQPRSFRPGYFSANDNTFRVLHELGFRQGSVSCPERWAVRWRAVWVGMYRTANHASSANRLIPGNLDFLEVPNSIDWEKRYPPNPELPQELGLERGTIETHRTTIEKNIVDMVYRSRVPLKTICSFTHNYVDYSKGPHKRMLQDLVDYLWKVGDKYGLKIVPSTVEQIHKAFDENKTP